MTLAELRALLGREVVAVTGSNESGYEKHRGSLDNIIVNAMYYPDRTDTNMDVTVTTVEPHMTIQINAKRLFNVAQETAVTTKINKINAALAIVTGEDI